MSIGGDSRSIGDSSADLPRSPVAVNNGLEEQLIS